MTASSARPARPSPARLSPPQPSPEPSPAKAVAGENVSPPRYSSDQATINLIRRVLGPAKGSDATASLQPVEDRLPSLTSSNQVDLQLYALIAELVRAFVQPWYGPMAPEGGLVEEMVHIIAHATRAIEERLRRLDLMALLLDEMPALVDRHIVAYRRMHDASVFWHGPMLQPSQYHALSPHPALSPVPRRDRPETVATQSRNEIAYRQLLVQGVLAVLLPVEDLQNPGLRILLTDILADVILGRVVSERMCQPCFFHQMVIKMASLVKGHLQPETAGPGKAPSPRRRLEEFGLLSTKQDRWASDSSPTDQSQTTMSTLMWQAIRYVCLFLLCARFVVTGLYRARWLPARSHSPVAPSLSPIGPASSAHPTSSCPPVLDYGIFNLLASILHLSARMPWLAGLLCLAKHGALDGPHQAGATNSILDRFLHSSIATHLTPWPRLLPTILLSVRTALFPATGAASEGADAPASPDPAEQARLRKQAAESVLALIPPGLARIYFAPRRTATGTTEEPNGVPREGAAEAPTDDVLAQIDHDMLSPFSDPYLNRHLVYALVDLLIARLVPEMADGEEAGQSVSDLLVERGVGGVDRAGDGSDVAGAV